MVFWLVFIFLAIIVIGVFLFLISLITQKNEIKNIEKEKSHNDSKVIAQLAHHHLGTPSTALVRSKFCDLRFSQKSASYLRALSQLKKQDYDGIINKVENKFIRIDRAIFNISSLCKSKKDDKHHQEFIFSHEQKYYQIL